MTSSASRESERPNPAVQFRPDGEQLVVRVLSSSRRGRSHVSLERRRYGRGSSSASRVRFNETSPVISPERAWIAYVSDSGRNLEIHVRPFPERSPTGDGKISTDGAGTSPLWAPDGTGSCSSSLPHARTQMGAAFPSRSESDEEGWCYPRSEASSSSVTRRATQELSFRVGLAPKRTTSSPDGRALS